jgi:hypothetical protein
VVSVVVVVVAVVVVVVVVVVEVVVVVVEVVAVVVVVAAAAASVVVVVVVVVVEVVVVTVCRSSSLEGRHDKIAAVGVVQAVLVAVLMIGLAGMRSTSISFVLVFVVGIAVYMVDVVGPCSPPPTSKPLNGSPAAVVVAVAVAVVVVGLADVGTGEEVMVGVARLVVVAECVCSQAIKDAGSAAGKGSLF